jgi:hypothetical protein
MSTQIQEQKCPVCKRIFIPAPYHVYKAYGKQRFVCSYGCMLESRRQATEKKKYKKRGIKENEI